MAKERHGCDRCGRSINPMGKYAEVWGHYICTECGEKWERVSKPLFEIWRRPEEADLGVLTQTVAKFLASKGLSMSAGEKGNA